MPAPSQSVPVSDACPDEEKLLRFVDGERDTDVAAHVRGCALCQRAVGLVLSAEPSGEAEDSVVRRLAALQKARASVLPPGQRVDRYEIVRLVGQGGMGIVYAAHDPELDREVAIKVMHAREEAGDENRRMLREARALAKVAHPHVVAVYDVGTFEGRVFLVMELVEGATLREWLLEERDADAVLDVFMQAGEGLAAAHDAGLVHRDFKPDNILIGEDDRVRVTDFGLARATRPSTESRITASAAVVGTLSYMAPEVQRGDEADERSDQYSFAVALYRALTGHGPRTDLPIVDDVDALPRRLRRTMRRALALDRAGRFPSMRALLRELEVSRHAHRRTRAIGVGLALVVAAGLTYAATREERSVATESAPMAATNEPAQPEPTVTTRASEPSADGEVAGAPAPSASQLAAPEMPRPAPRPKRAPAPPPRKKVPDPLSEF